METGTPIQSKSLPGLVINHLLEEDYDDEADLVNQVISKMGELGFLTEITRKPSGETFAIFRLPDGGVGLGVWRNDFDSAVFLAALQAHLNAHISVVDDETTNV